MTSQKRPQPHSLLIVGGNPTQRRDHALALVAERIKTAIGEVARHPDLLYLNPIIIGPKLGIDQVRDLIKQLAKTPYQAPAKVALIEEADRATPEAQNALLKTLEEPPRQAVIILTASQTSSLLPTIVSRCQLIRLPPVIESLPPEEMAKHLTELGRALRLNRGERLAWVEKNKKVFTNREEVLQYLEAWITGLRDCLLWQQQRPDLGYSPTLQKEVESLNASSQEWLPLLTEGLRHRQLIKKSALNPRLAWENFLLKLPVLE